MRKLSLFIVLLFLFQVISVAQEAPKVEIFAGYSEFVTPHGFLSNGSFGPGVSIADRANLKGWNASVTGNANRWLGVEGDFGGYYGHVASQITIDHVGPGGGITSTTFNDTAKVRFYSFLLGPRISYRGSERVTPYVHALAGGIRETIEGPQIPSGSSQTSFGLALGGGVDVKVAEGVAIRVVQADYVRSQFGSKFGNNMRLSFGAVFRF